MCFLPHSWSANISILAFALVVEEFSPRIFWRFVGWIADWSLLGDIIKFGILFEPAPAIFVFQHWAWIIILFAFESLPDAIHLFFRSNVVLCWVYVEKKLVYFMDQWLFMLFHPFFIVLWKLRAFLIKIGPHSFLWRCSYSTILIVIHTFWLFMTRIAPSIRLIDHNVQITNQRPARLHPLLFSFGNLWGGGILIGCLPILLLFSLDIFFSVNFFDLFHKFLIFLSDLLFFFLLALLSLFNLSLELFLVCLLITGFLFHLILINIAEDPLAEGSVNTGVCGRLLLQEGHSPDL